MPFSFKCHILKLTIKELFETSMKIHKEGIAVKLLIGILPEHPVFLLFSFLFSLSFSGCYSLSYSVTC
jgi:hypothetical protein